MIFFFSSYWNFFFSSYRNFFFSSNGYLKKNSGGLSLLIEAKFWKLWHLQGIIGDLTQTIRLTQMRQFWGNWILSDLISILAEKKIKTDIQNLTLDSSFDALSKWHDPQTGESSLNILGIVKTPFFILSLVFLLISNLTNGLCLHQFLGKQVPKNWCKITNEQKD